MDKWKSGSLKSGGSGAPVKSQKQAVAIMLSEKKAAKGGKKEYMANSKESLTPGNTPIRSVLGRKVISNSPDKHPEQADAQVQDPWAKILSNADTNTTTGTLQQSRQDTGSAAQGSGNMPRPGSTYEDIKNKVKGYFK